MKPPNQPHQAPPAKLPPGIESVAPPPAGALPSDVRGVDAQDVKFWKPPWGETLSHMGWRWLLVGLPLVIAVALLVGLYSFGFSAVLWWFGLKAVIMLVALPLSVLAYLVRTAIRRRKEPFCIHCGYGLGGLRDHYRCPECGRPYTFALIDEYRRDPHWFIRRWKSRHDLPAADAPFIAGSNPGPRSRDGT